MVENEWETETREFFGSRPRVVLKALMVTMADNELSVFSFSNQITWLTANMDLVTIPLFTTVGGFYRLTRFKKYSNPFMDNSAGDSIEFFPYAPVNNIMWVCTSGWTFVANGFHILFDQQCFEMSKDHRQYENNEQVQHLLCTNLLPPLSALIISFLLISVPTLSKTPEPCFFPPDVFPPHLPTM
jgi:hypothetical protein